MIEEKFPVNIHDCYHAHVYFDEETLEHATGLCEQAGERFGLKVGRVHRKQVGPHPKWSCQIIFSHQDFDKLIPWLNEERNGLTVLVHAVTGDNMKDHTDYAYWLGDSVALNLSVFSS